MAWFRPPLPVLRHPVLGWIAVDGLLITVFAWMVCLLLMEREPEIRWLRLPSNGFGVPDRDPANNRLTVTLRPDRAGDGSTYLVGRATLSVPELKQWMYRLARCWIDPVTKFSEIPLLIRAPGDTPFADVARVFALCMDKDIQIYRVLLEVAETGRPAETSGWPRRRPD